MFSINVLIVIIIAMDLFLISFTKDEAGLGVKHSLRSTRTIQH